MRVPTRSLRTRRAAALWVVLSSAPALLLAQAQKTAPIWGKPDAFWYRAPVPGGNRWMVVDAKSGVRGFLFDHQRLATELTLKSRTEYAALMLPFAEPDAQFVVKYDGTNPSVPEGGRAIEFVLGEDAWRCELEAEWDWLLIPPTDYQCENKGQAPMASPGSPSASPARLSPDGRWEAFVQSSNVAIRPAGGRSGNVVVLSSDGTPDFAYQAGSIHWSADGKTVTAYRVRPDVWRSAEPGSVKSQVGQGRWGVP
jgi:hypothetical protein